MVLKRPFIKSLGYALHGVYVAVKTERNFKFHIPAAVLAAAAGFYAGLSGVEWCLVIFAIGFVLAAELVNTAVEKFGDKMSGGQYDEIIKTCKDMAAAAVLIAAIAALIIGIIVLVIPIIQKIF